MTFNFTTRLQALSLLFASLFFAATPAMAQFWTEDFSDGIIDWQTFDNVGNTYQWEATTTGPYGTFPNDPLHEAGSGETWILYDSDADCSGNQDAWIMSPAIDCSAESVVWLQFTQLYRNFNDVNFVNVSTDNGENWTAFPVNDLVEVNEFGNSLITLNITDVAAEQSAVNIAFQFRSTPADTQNDPGCAYSWQIDNVSLFNVNPKPPYDLSLTLDGQSFYAVPQNLGTPASQVEPIYFLSDVYNEGSESQDNINLNVTILDSNGNPVYSQDMDYGTIDTSMQNIPFPESWTPPATPSQYVGVYTLTSPNEDAIPENNQVTFSLTVTDSTFAKDATLTNFLAPAFGDDESHTWGMGNFYHIVNDVDENNDKYAITSVQIAIGNREPGLTGQFFEVFVYEVQDEGIIGEILYDELVPVAFNVVEFTGDGSGNPQLVSFDVEVFNIDQDLNDPVYLKADTDYIVMARYTDSDPTPDSDTEFWLIGSNEIDYSAQVFLSRPDNGDGTGLGVSPIRLASVLVNAPEGDFAGNVDFFTAGFGDDLVPLIRMNINPVVPISTEELSDDNVINVSPNPASEILNLEVDFVNMAETLQVRFVNVNGQEVFTKDFSNIQKDVLTFDVSAFAVGTYYVYLTTEAGAKIKKVVIQK